MISFINKILSFIYNKATKKELYINVLSWARVPAPQASDKPIPIFGRPIEQSQEHAVVNVALNPNVLDDSDLKSLVLTLVFDYIETQNNLKVDRNNYTIVKEKNYFGDVSQLDQFTSIKKTPAQDDNSSIPDSDLPENLIKRLSSLGARETSSNEASSKKMIIEEITKTSEAEKRSLLPVFEEKVQNSMYSLKIHLPLVESFSECELNIDSNKKVLILDIPGKNEYKKLEISIRKLEDSYFVDTDHVEAKFVRKDKVLRVKIPLKPNDNVEKT